MMIGDAMTPFDPVLACFSFFSMLFSIKFDVTVFDITVFDVTLLTSSCCYLEKNMSLKVIFMSISRNVKMLPIVTRGRVWASHVKPVVVLKKIQKFKECFFNHYF